MCVCVCVCVAVADPKWRGRSRFGSTMFFFLIQIVISMLKNKAQIARETIKTKLELVMCVLAHNRSPPPPPEIPGSAPCIHAYAHTKMNIEFHKTSVLSAFHFQDPVDNMAYTLPNLTEWQGSTITLPCDFLGTPDKVLWNRQQTYGSSRSIETILSYDNDIYHVIGDRRFGWSTNFAMVARDLEVTDEGNYSCQVWRPDKDLLENGTVVTVNGIFLSSQMHFGHCLATKIITHSYIFLILYFSCIYYYTLRINVFFE